MKRVGLIVLAAIALAIAGCSATPEYGAATFQAHPLSAYVSSVGCSGQTPFGNADECEDATNNLATYIQSGGTWTLKPSSPSSISTTGSITTSNTGASALSVTAGGLFSVVGGTLPTATCSGGSTGVSMTTGSNDNRGQITTSSSASTNCTITFVHTWPAGPFCVFTDANSSVTPVAYSFDVAGSSTTAVKFDFASVTSKVVNYICE